MSTVATRQFDALSCPLKKGAGFWFLLAWANLTVQA